MIPLRPGFGCENLFDGYTKPIVKSITERLENAPIEKLQQIVRSYESAPWYQKAARILFFDEPQFYETNLEYLCARDTLLGRCSWEKASEERLELIVEP